MKSTHNKRCAVPDCAKGCLFGFEWKKPTHCGEHGAPLGMTDVKSKRCANDDCDIFPTFGSVFGSPTHCKTHGESLGMKNARNMECEECPVRASYGLEYKKPTHCATHGKPKGMSDVMHNRCLECPTRATYGLDAKKPTHCEAHGKPKGLKGVVNLTCMECDKRPNYGLEYRKPTHCIEHGTQKNMFDVASVRCEHCSMTRVNQTYKPYCAECHFKLNPHDPRIRNYKTKEHAFVIPIQKIYPEMILDKAVVGGCSRRRPDGHIECLTHSVIIEVDEDQHMGYTSICENRRMMHLYTDLGNRPIVFIRINPDSYKNGKKRVKGCFTLSKKTGVLLIDKKEFSRRFEQITEVIANAVKTVPDRAISSQHLFFSKEYTTHES